MNLAEISSTGQVTVPPEIRRRLRLKEGDKLLFIERGNGEVVIDNASAAASAIARAQQAFAGAAGDFGVANDDEAQRLVDEMRYGTEEGA